MHVIIKVRTIYLLHTPLKVVLRVRVKRKHDCKSPHKCKSTRTSVCASLWNYCVEVKCVNFSFIQISGSKLFSDFSKSAAEI